MWKSLFTPFGKLRGRTTSEPATPQDFRPLTPEEDALRLEFLSVGLDLAVENGISRPDSPPLGPTELDRLWEVLEPSSSRPDEEKQFLAKLFGYLFGEHLSTFLGLSWGVIADQYGTDIALRHQVGEVTVYPLSSVLKRLEKDEVGFFQPLSFALEKQVREMLEEHGVA